MSAHTRRRRALLLAVALWAAPYFSAAQSQRNVLEATTNPEAWGFSSTKLAHLRVRMQSYVEERKLPGLSTLLARKGQVIFFEQYGLQNVERRLPMQAHTIFRLASMTKPITSVAVMMLYEQGKLRLDDPVSKFIPSFAQTKVLSGKNELVELERPITIKHLLMHMSGLPFPGMGHSPLQERYRQAELHKAASLAEYVERIAALPLAHQPGASWTYGVSTDVLARVVEVIAQMPFDRFLAQKIFTPLEMNDTGYSVPLDKLNRFAALYSTVEEKSFKLIDAPESSSFAQPPKFARGVGGLTSTAPDYFRFVQMLVNGGELEGARLLKPETVSLMARNHLPEHVTSLGGGPVEFRDNGFGLGFGVALSVKENATASNGFWWNRGAPPAGSCWWIGASNTYFWFDPANDIIGIVLAQTTEVMKHPFMQEFHTLVYEAFEKEKASY